MPQPQNKGRIVVRGKAKALYSFRAQGPRELSMRKGDVIYLIRDVDKNWYEGEHHGCVGIVPKSYVQVIVSLDDARTSAFEREGQAVAKFNFVARTNSELPLQKVNFTIRVSTGNFKNKFARHEGGQTVV